MRDVYHQPEEFGLTIVAEVDFGCSYDFDMHVIWKDAAGVHYYATDSGCSCPSPFEDYDSIESLERVDSRTYDRVCGEFAGKAYSEAHEFLSVLRDIVAVKS